MSNETKPFNCLNIANKSKQPNMENSTPFNVLQHQNILKKDEAYPGVRSSASTMLNNINSHNPVLKNKYFDAGNGKMTIKDFDCLNIGVPSNSLVKPFIVSDDISFICNGDKTAEMYKVLERNLNALYEKINNELGVKYSFLKPGETNYALSIYTDENLKTFLSFSGVFAACSFKSNFNIDGDIIELLQDPELVRKIAEEKTKNLRSIKSPKELKKKFPKLFEKYDWIKKGVTLVNAIKQCKNELTKTNILYEFSMLWGGKYEEWIEYSKDFSFEKYINDIADMYFLYFKNFKDVLMLIESTPIYFTEECNIDENKLALLAAFSYLINAKLSGDKDAQKYLYYVASYIKEYKDKQNGESLKVIDFTSENSLKHKKNVNYNYISEKFSELLIDNPELNFIDFSREYFSGMTTKEIEEYMDDYLSDVKLNWDFLPPSDESISRETFELIQQEGKKHKEVDEEAFKQRLIDLFMEKKNLFDSSNPFCMLKGKGAFSGYVGYCYSNGKVILDKYYENDKKKKLAFGDAIYVMDLSNFYKLSRRSKRQLINEKACRRIYHRGEWKERVNEEIFNGVAMQKSELNRRIKDISTNQD